MGEVILKINIVQAEKIEAEIYVNQDKSLSVYKHWLNINFFCFFLMNY
jgi:hypothetical protein